MLPALEDTIIGLLSVHEALTDLHLSAGEPMRSRRCGTLSVVDDSIVDESALFSLLRGLVALEGAAGTHVDALRRALRSREGGALDFSAALGSHRLRGNVHLRAAGSLGLVLRRLRDTVPDLDALGLPVLLRRLVDRSRGLLLVTGPTGSGKSTTLAALVQHLVCSRALHVLTIEDPIEYRLDRTACPGGGCALGHVTSREVGADAPDFASAVRAAMRQDPDVIVIGEIRDRATMHAALSAAETGHLVLATLHAPNASEAVERVLSFFAPDERTWARSVFANVLAAVLSQALVRRRDEAAQALVCELMVSTPAVRQQILQGTTGQLRGIMAQGRRDGHVQMTAQLADRVRRGEIAEEDARYVAHPAEEFAWLMQSSSGGQGA
ncbi:MAG: type IV pilus twitching motility protein PilT [bacterium]